MLALSPLMANAAVFYDFEVNNSVLDINGIGSLGFDPIPGGGVSLTDFDFIVATAWNPLTGRNTDGYHFGLSDIGDTSLDYSVNTGLMGFFYLKNIQSTPCNGLLGNGNCFITGNQSDRGPIIAAGGHFMGREWFSRSGSQAFRDFSIFGSGSIRSSVPEPGIFQLIMVGLIAYGIRRYFKY